MAPNETNPREGMMAVVRNRRALISRVKPFGSKTTSTLHVVDLEYTDLDGDKPSDSVIWEREVGARLIAPRALPQIHDDAPMTPSDFDALLRASRWSGLTPFLAPDGSGEAPQLPLASPFHGAVQVEDFQLVPLLTALQMPRISLLLADDVGLGKTIEAGLILTELLLRRRIRRVLVMTPASLRDQWQQEMHEKFSLSFDVVDRRETHQMRRRLGLDANPWRTFPRIITSYHYLRQADVLQEFLATCRGENLAKLPWDLLIVDEAHNLMPAAYGKDSELSRMLAAISPYFEHKLFLTATPHNGHTRSYSGLLELLDPVRFNRTSKFSPAEKQRVDQVVIRRLKRELNEHDKERGRQPRFAHRQLDDCHLYFSGPERALSTAFAAFRGAVKAAISRQDRKEQLAGSFAVEVLNKRLLSSPYTFADSWYRFIEGTKSETDASDGELLAARRADQEDIADDREKESRGGHAARTAGAWLKPFVTELSDEIEAVSKALVKLGLRRDGERVTDPKQDARFDALVKLIEERLREGELWAADERLIVFTEYKTTLDYLSRRLAARYENQPDKPERVALLFGGMDDRGRREIKDAFNDPAASVRVLLATDAASEGLNLQDTARLLLHYEIPWNPSRLEQRNGRLDRHGQARDVTIHHFSSEDDADLRFLSRVVTKIETIREDLGTLGELFDAAFTRRFVDFEDGDIVADMLDDSVEHQREQIQLPRKDPAAGLARVEDAKVRQLRRDVDLDPDTLRDTLEVALGLELGHPRIEGPDGRGRFRLNQNIPARWKGIIDDALRLPIDGSALSGSIPHMVFDPGHFIEERLGRPVFRASKGTVLLHLGHPLFRHALASFAPLRFSGTDYGLRASCWTVRRGPVPAGTDALILVSVEEMAVNSLREPFHHWVRTLRIPVVDEELGEPLAYLAPSDDLHPAELDDASLDHARELWSALSLDVRDLIDAHSAAIEKRVGEGLEARRAAELTRARKAFNDRIAEVRAGMKKNTLEQLSKEIEKKQRERQQVQMFAADQREIEQEIAQLQEEYDRRVHQSEQLLELLQREKQRVIERLLPQRFSLRGGGVQVFPLTVEIRLPEVGQ